MKITIAIQNLTILCTAFLMITTISCNNDGQYNLGNIHATGNRNGSAVEGKMDSSRLKYKRGVRSILEDSKGNTWFGSYNEGVCLLHNGKLQYFTTENGLSDNQVRNIYEDKNGIIWFECGTGLSNYDGQKISAYHKRNYQSKKEWSSRRSDLWFKADESVGYNKLEERPGVYQYNGETLSYMVFPVRPTIGDNFTYSISTAFVKANNGTIWFGTYGAAIGYTGSDFKIIDNEYLGLNDKTGFLHIRSLMEDSKGNLWIGNNGKAGVFKYDGKATINFTAQQKLKKEDTNGNALERVFSIGEDKAGNIWFGTVGSGVWKYDGKSTTNFTKADGLESNHSWLIYKSKSGELWFAGADPSAVFRFNGKSFERIF